MLLEFILVGAEQEIHKTYKAPGTCHRPTVVCTNRLIGGDCKDLTRVSGQVPIDED